MIRYAGRAVALFTSGTLFAVGAWAATLAQTASDPYVIAEELLGSDDGTVVRLSSGRGGDGAAERPSLRLTTDFKIAAGNQAYLTYTLTGAVFARQVFPQDLLLLDGSGSQTAGLVSRIHDLGDEGTATVSIWVAAREDIGVNETISFLVPDLLVSPETIGYDNGGNPVRGVAITATSVVVRAVTTEDGAPFPKVSGAVDTSAANNLVNRQVLKLADAVSISLGAAVNRATVAVDERTVFQTSNATYTAEGEDPINALRVGTLTATVSGATPDGDRIYTQYPARPVLEDNGTPNDPADDFMSPTLGGNVDVVVSGAFRTDDQVVYGAGDLFSKAELSNGQAAVSVPIAPGGGQTEFLYVPGGVEALSRGDFTAVAMLDFNLDGNDNGDPVISMGTISYAGLERRAYAHGVVKTQGADLSFLRVRCAALADCSVFIDCYDQDGENYFGELGEVPGNATRSFSSDYVGGVFRGGWKSGRGACELLSDNALEVQHLVRSNGVLKNNSAVVGRSLGEDRLDGIDQVLADICASVEGHSGRLPSTGVSRIAATVCGNAKATAVGNDVDANGDDPGT